jgi:hypothetical protein
MLKNTEEKTFKAPFTSKEIPILNDIERFLSKIKINLDNECWEWTAMLDHKGYGRFYKFVNGKGAWFKSHRVSYDVFNGRIDSCMPIDHICRNRKCVNPDHLRQVSVKTNSLENSKGITAKNNQKTHCKKGHEFTMENTRLVKNLGHRVCKECAYLNSRDAGIKRRKK